MLNFEFLILNQSFELVQISGMTNTNSQLFRNVKKIIESLHMVDVVYISPSDVHQCCIGGIICNPQNVYFAWRVFQRQTNGFQILFCTSSLWISIKQKMDHYSRSSQFCLSVIPVSYHQYNTCPIRADSFYRVDVFIEINDTPDQGPVKQVEHTFFVTEGTAPGKKRVIAPAPQRLAPYMRCFSGLIVSCWNGVTVFPAGCQIHVNKERGYNV